MPESVRVDYDPKEYERLVADQKGRASWRVSVHAGSLADVCKMRVGYHAGRRKWWQAEVEKSEQQVRDSGFELREQQVTGGQRFEAVMDAALANRLSECKRKVQGHRDMERTYQEWADFLGAMSPESPLWLSIEDTLFFQPKPREAK